MNKKILVVDDEPLIREMFKKAFSKAGYYIQTVSSAEDALEILKENTFQVMFFDLNLPGMNGVDLCRKVRANNPISIIYAITGYASMFELAECREAGFDDYFTKPVTLQSLYNATESAFKKIDRWKNK